MNDTENSTRELVRLADRAPVGIVDRKRGIIYGVSMLTANREASGHGMYVDEIMADQVVELAAAKMPLGLKCRFDHPTACSRAVGTFVGRFRDARRDGLHARADLYLSDAAAKSPDGDLRDYILTLAEEDPEAFATSIVFMPGESYVPDRADQSLREAHPDEKDPFWKPHARIKSLHHCDVVDEGAANDGLFGRPNYWAEQVERWANEHEGVVSRWLNGWLTKHHAKLAAYEENAEMDELRKQLAALMDESAVRALALQALEAEVLALREDAAKVPDALRAEFDAGVAQGEDQLAGKVAARLAKFGSAEFVAHNIGKTDDELDAMWIAANQERVEGTKGAATAPAGDSPDENAPRRFDYNARVRELKAAGLSTVEAHRQAHDEQDEAKRA